MNTMKKWLGAVVIATGLLVACGNNEDAINEQTEQTTNDADMQQMIEQSLRQKDELITYRNEGNEIYSEVKLTPQTKINHRAVAVQTYEKASKRLLKVDDWEVLTMTFNNVGTISFNKSEAVEGDDGLYFSGEEMMKQLNEEN